MLRETQEAKAIVAELFGDSHPEYILNALVAHYRCSNEWACNNCGNTGTILKVKNTSIRSSSCMCRSIRDRKLKIAKLRGESNIPQLYTEATVDKWQNPGRTEVEKSLNHASFHTIHHYQRKVAEMIKKGYGLYLTGPNGVGKTYLACCVVNRAIDSGLRVRYCTMAKITRMQIDGWFDDDSKQLVTDIRTADLLVLDDLDKVYKTKTGIETSLFDNMLRERLQSNLSCIFTSNRTINDAKEDFGPHIHSMLKEHCAELVIVGSDYRSSDQIDIRRKIIND
jgi:DNA replication protein DnaC